MHSSLRVPSILSPAVVAILLATPLSAQMDSALQPRLMRSSYSVVRPYVEQRDPAHALAALPANMIVSDVYADVVEFLRLKSATFRRQCARIANARQLTVVIQQEFPAGTLRPPALTHIARFEHGLIRATVRVMPSYRVPELIAHELEHVLEQLDDVDLQEKSRLAASGVRRCHCGGTIVFETTRAVAAGERVARELERN